MLTTGDQPTRMNYQQMRLLLLDTGFCADSVAVGWGLRCAKAASGRPAVRWPISERVVQSFPLHAAAYQRAVSTNGPPCNRLKTSLT